MIRDKKTNKLYYGYISTLLAGLTIFGSTGILNNAAAQFIAYLTVNLGWNASIVSNAFSLRTMFCLIMPVIGIAVTKFGPRKTICYTTVITSLALIVTGYCKGPWMFMIVFGVAVGLSMMFNDTMATQAVVANWWTTKRAAWSGRVNAMAALGGMIIPPIIAIGLNTWGWKLTLIACGIALFVITALPQFFLMKDHPEDVGQEMEGGHLADAAVSAENAAEPVNEINWDAKDAVKTPQLWIVALCWGFMCVAYACVMYFSVTHFVLNGVMDNVRASLFISVLSAVTAVCGFFFGGIVDRLGSRWGYFIACIMAGISCILMNTVTGSVVTWILPIVLFAFPNAMLNPLATMTLARYYGPKNFAKIQGWLYPVFTIMSAATSSLIGIYLAKSGELSKAFLVCGLLTLVGCILALFLKKPKVPEKYLNR